MIRVRFAAIAAVSLLSTAAFAGWQDWDWPEEFQARHWRPATLQWAQALHPEHPSFDDLVAYYAPPAEELWCHGPGQPDEVDLEIHANLLEDWARDFLEVGPNQPLPLGVAAFPRECQ